MIGKYAPDDLCSRRVIEGDLNNIQMSSVKHVLVHSWRILLLGGYTQHGLTGYLGEPTRG